MKQLRLILLAFVFSGLPAMGANDAPPPDAASILAALDALVQKHQEAREAGVGAVIRKVQDASKSPTAAVDFYEQAIMLTQFSGLTRENGKFKEWKEKEAPKLKDRHFARALQFHLLYLAITLKAAATGKPEQLVPDLITFTGDLLSWTDELIKTPPDSQVYREWLTKPVNDGLFPQALQLQGAFSGLEKWEMSVGNVDSIFQKTILPELRRSKDPRIITYWDRRMERRSEQLRLSKQEFDVDRFATMELPGLLWQRAQEYRNLNQPNRALNEMLAVIRKYPDHPDLPKWVSEVREALKPAIPTPPAETPEGAPAAPASAPN